MKFNYTYNTYEYPYEKFVRGIFEEEETNVKPFSSNLKDALDRGYSAVMMPPRQGFHPCSRCEKNKAIKIKDVIFNDPATIVFWNDGTKTVVKAENEPFDREKGLAMAIAKKHLGNKGNYFETFKKFIKEDE